MEAAVDNQDKASQDSREPGNGAPPLEGTPQAHSGATEPATAQQLEDVEQQMSSFEKATLRWAKTAVILSGLAAIFVCAQWWEMHEGGIDTRNLATAAQQQAKAASDFATSASGMNNKLETAVGKLNDQAGATHDLAAEARNQAQEARVAADAAKSAADTAKDALHISERAYLTLGAPIDDFPNRRISVPVFNSGHVPSGVVKVVTHEATSVVPDPTKYFVPLTPESERHWKVATYESIPVIPNGGLFTMEVHLPKLVEADLKTGKQSVIVAIEMTYNDGFPNTPEQRWIFCDQSSFISSSNYFLMRPCDNPTAILQLLKNFDKYPDPKYQEQ